MTKIEKFEPSSDWTEIVPASIKGKVNALIDAVNQQEEQIKALQKKLVDFDHVTDNGKMVEREYAFMKLPCKPWDTIIYEYEDKSVYVEMQVYAIKRYAKEWNVCIYCKDEWYHTRSFYIWEWEFSITDINWYWMPLITRRK